MKAHKHLTSLFVLLALLCLHTSCGKDSGTEDLDPIDKNLLGRWTLTGYYNGWLAKYAAANPATPEAIEFDAKGRVFYYKNNVLTHEATYRLEKQSDPNVNIAIQNADVSQVYVPNFYSIHGDSLVIGTPANVADGGTGFYCRNCASANKAE